MDTASPQSGPLNMPLHSAQSEGDGIDKPFPAPLSMAGLAPATSQEVFLAAECEACGLTPAELGNALSMAGERCNYGYAAEVSPDAAQRASFVRNLRLTELALAQACALGHEIAWKRFIKLYRAQLTHAAMAITRSATLGQELADSLYAELYEISQPGLKNAGGAAEPPRTSPLASYSGRGSLLGWLRTTLAQRHFDNNHRRRRETVPGACDTPATESATAPLPAHLSYLKHAITRTLRSLDSESRFLLSAYFLDERTLPEIGRMLHLHESTISRKIKGLSHDLRDELLRNLEIGGLSHQAAEEALGIDPRDLEINLRWLLQTSRAPSLQEEATAQAETQSSESEKS